MTKGETKTAKNHKEVKTELLDLSLEGIKKFVEFAKEFNISTLSIGQKGKKITVTKRMQAVSAQVMETNNSLAEIEYTPESYEKIKSKFIGSFHAGKNIGVGSAVKKGDVVASISSMRINHEIKAEKDCKLKEVLVKENDPIEYGQPLYIIE